jgi:hypothetical protein
VVSLVDLFIATLLPDDLFDLTFEIATTHRDGPRRARARRGPFDGLRLAHAYVAVETRTLHWDEGAPPIAEGARVDAVLVRRRAPPPARATTDARALAAELLPLARAPYPPITLHEVEHDPTPSFLATLRRV